MSIWVTGDIHGSPQRFSSDIFPEQNKMTKNDAIIILGDFGLVWDYTGENKTEKYWLDWLEKKPFTTVFIDGNHDNFDRLDKYPFALYRINHMSWWERELPNEEELKEGLINLEKHGNKVDYIITHSPYTSLLRQMDGGSGLYHSDRLTDYLQEIKQTVEYKHWLFGHMHINHTFHWEKSSCLYEQIIRIF